MAIERVNLDKYETVSIKSVLTFWTKKETEEYCRANNIARKAIGHVENHWNPDMWGIVDRWANGFTQVLGRDGQYIALTPLPPRER